MTSLIVVVSCVFLAYISQAYSNITSSNEYVPCEEGWYFFRGKCYRAEGREPSERLSWYDALARCKSYGADLVSIQSQEEQDFVVTYLVLNVTWWSWIGLHDPQSIKDFKWTDGSLVNYTNWHKDNPSIFFEGEPEQCAQIFMDPEPLGEWNDKSCDAKDAYICEKNTNPDMNNLNPIFCSPEEGGGWRHKNSCYHIVSEHKSWENAENHCNRHYNGHLLTIHDKMEDYFLDFAIPSTDNKFWIGIKMENQLQQKWTSGWYVSYQGFYNHRIKSSMKTCVAWRRRQDWVTFPCSTQLPFICEVSKESPAVLKPSPIGAHCPNNHEYWRDLGGEYCYYIDATRHISFYDAKRNCLIKGGYLASLHSQEESDILQPFFLYKQYSIFIGLQQNEENGAFEWMDGTELDYQNWNDDQPDNIEEKCVEMWIRTKKWNDIPCNKRNVGYVCSVKKIVPKPSFNHETTSIRTDSTTVVTESIIGRETASIQTDINTSVPESSLVYESTTIQRNISASVPESSSANETTTIHADITTLSTFDDAQQLNVTPKNENVSQSLTTGGIFGVVICVLVTIILIGAMWYYFRPRNEIRPKLLDMDDL